MVNVNKDVSRETGFKFFFPLVNLSLGNRNHDSDQNPERTQPKQLPQWEFWGKGLV